ncbi:MAG TPA: patatin, partial [Thermoanaerobaculia bacterium]
LSPALHLGAGRILAMSTRYQRTFDEADQPVIHGYPPPIQVLGHLMNAIFLDIIDQDAWRLEKFNQLLEQIPPERRDRFRPVDIFVLRPSQDLGRLAAKYEPSLPKGVRFLFRGLGAKETSSPDFLSLLMFQHDYLSKLIEIGEADGEAQMDEILALIR